MWRAINIESTETNTKFIINEENESITCHRFLTLLKTSEEFRNFYNKYLAVSKFDAFFWENKPIAKHTLQNIYECNLINSDYLAERLPDFQTFSTRFKNDKSAVSFPNLGGDAQLIVPCPQKNHSVFTHIGSFVREADREQVNAFWKLVAKEALNCIGTEPSWLSTSGLGVFWLHVRIDSFPKYYQTEEYKKL